MNIHPSLAPALWGAVGGAAAIAIIGFTWGGWVTAGNAQRSADNRVASAVVEALAPICLVQFQQKPDNVVQLTALKKINPYDQTAFVEKAGWATMPGSTTPSSGVARVCAKLIDDLK